MKDIMKKLHDAFLYVEWTEIVIPVYSGIFGGLVGIALYKIMF